MSFYQSTTGQATFAGAAPPRRASESARNAANAFQMADLAQLVARRRRLILGIALGVVLLTAAIAFALPTVYSSSAVIMLDQRRNSVADISSVLSQLPNDPATMQNQIQLITSRALAERVIGSLQLYNDPEFNSVLKPDGDLRALLSTLLSPGTWFSDPPTGADTARIHDQIMDSFLKHVSAEAKGLSTTMTVSVDSRDPAKAARIANALAAAYVEDQAASRRGANDATTGWLTQKIQALAEEMQAQEAAAQTYKAQHGLTDSAPGSSLVDQQMAGINNQIVQARSDVAEKQANSDRINNLLQSGNAADVSEVVASPLIVQLRTQEAQLLRDESDAESKYGPLHPRMQTLEAQKRDLDEKIGVETRRIAGAAANEVAVARAHLNSLQQSLGGAVHQATGQNMARVQLQALESNAATTRAQYEAFLTRLRQTQDQDTLPAPESRIISPAAVPLRPSAPHRSLMIGAALPGGLLLGLFVALLTERFGFLFPAAASGAPAEPVWRAVPALGAIRPNMRPPKRATMATPSRPSKTYRQRPPPAKPPPRLPAPPWNGPPILVQIADSADRIAGDYVLDYPASTYARRMTSLAQQLESRPEGGFHPGAAVIAITAAEPGENKSAIGVSLARAAALRGKKTLLLDCDPAQAASSAMHTAATAGLFEVLTGATPLNQAFAKDPRTDAFVLTLVRHPPNFITMFSSHQMARLIDILRGSCDMVVIDCGGAGPEASLLAQLADATILVARQSALHAPSLAKSVRQLRDARAAPIGIVVTN